MNTLWLVRHGEPEGVSGICYGRSDPPLSSIGKKQASAVAERLDGLHLDAIYASPLRRALETAQIIARPHNVAVSAVDALNEINFGVFEGLRYDEIRSRYAKEFQEWMEHPAQVVFPGGESLGMLRRRVLRSYRMLQAQHRNHTILIVTHSGVTRVILSTILGMPPTYLFRIGQRFGAINRIDYVEGKPVIDVING